MPSRNPVVAEIERQASALYPRDMDARFRERNRLRALAGLAPEKAKRGGLAGVYDRNKNAVGPAAAIIAGALLPATSVIRSLTSAAGVPLPSFTPTSGGTSMRPSNNLPVLQSNFAGGAVGVGRAVVTGAASGAVDTILTGLINRFLPPPAPAFGPQQGGAPAPKEGIIGRTISRILPGGMTGREWMPVNDMTDRVGRPLAVYPAERTQTVGPSGYVMVTMNGERIAMLKAFAIRAGLYKAPPKPPVSGYEMRAIVTAARAQKKVRKLAGKVGLRAESKRFLPRGKAAFGKRK